MAIDHKVMRTNSRERFLFYVLGVTNMATVRSLILYIWQI
jgi:hypothetical protein